MSRHSLAFLLAVSLSLAAINSARGVTSFNFDDGTAQGWTFISGSAMYSVGTAAATQGPAAHTPTFWVGPTTTTQWFAMRDGAHDTVIFRSPEFVLDGSGDLTAFLTGGEGNGNVQGTAPADQAALALTTGGAGVHWQGLALRDAMGNYLLSAQKPNEGGDFLTISWDQVGWTAAQLAPFLGQKLTLDFIDSRQGTWGWTGLDTIAIPGALAIPEPATLSLLTLASAAVLLRGRRRVA